MQIFTTSELFFMKLFLYKPFKSSCFFKSGSQTCRVTFPLDTANEYELEWLRISWRIQAHRNDHNIWRETVKKRLAFNTLKFGEKHLEREPKRDQGKFHPPVNTLINFWTGCSASFLGAWMEQALSLTVRVDDSSECSIVICNMATLDLCLRRVAVQCVFFSLGYIHNSCRYPSAG